MLLLKKQTCQKYIYKIHSGRLRKNGWKLTLSLQEARRNDELIALADSQILRWINELNGITDEEQEVNRIRAEIRRLKRDSTDAQGRKAIKRLYSQLDSIQFKPDYMCLIIDKEKDYYRACKGYSINGVNYVRLLGTNGGIKNSTIVFVSERLAPELRRRIDNGRNLSKELIPAKLEAYKALACSASTPVSLPHGIAVVRDCVTHFHSDVVSLSYEETEEPVMELRKDEPIELDASDGYGIMLPALAERWSKELGLDYVMSGANTRASFEKGMVFTFDFLDFAEQVSHQYYFQDVWGNTVDIRQVELILTESMLKLWDSYKSMDDYLSCCEENGYTFCITKVTPKDLENERNLNYQFIQSFQLSDDDIDELISPTMNELEDVLGGNWEKAVLFMCGLGLTPENAMRAEDGIAKAIMADRRMMDDPYVRSHIYQLIQKRIDEAKVGVLKVHGNYSIILGDPYALCQSIFGLPVTGLLKAGEIYSEYWRGSDELVCFRAPMTTHENIRRVHPCNSTPAQYWYRYIHTGTIFNAWDTAMAALNG